MRRPVETAQYLSITCTERLADAGINPPVGTVGDSYGDALAECVIGLCKTEVISAPGAWRTLRDADWQTPKWIDWRNNRRLLAPIGHIPPADAEARYYAELETRAVAAQVSKDTCLRETRRGSINLSVAEGMGLTSNLVHSKSLG